MSENTNNESQNKQESNSSEEKNIFENTNNNQQYTQASNPFKEKIYDAIRKGKFARNEEYISDPKEERAFVISNIIMGNATKPEKDDAFKYKYANIERLNDCIKKEIVKYNEKLEKSGINQRVVLSNTVAINSVNNTDCIAIAKHKCILYDINEIKLISKYTYSEEILMKNMFPDSICKDNSKCDDHIKTRGKCITYAKRYALLQFMQPSKLEDDPEESDKIKPINKQNNRTTESLGFNYKKLH